MEEYAEPEWSYELSVLPTEKKEDEFQESTLKNSLRAHENQENDYDKDPLLPQTTVVLPTLIDEGGQVMQEKADGIWKVCHLPYPRLRYPRLQFNIIWIKIQWWGWNLPWKVPTLKCEKALFEPPGSPMDYEALASQLAQLIQKEEDQGYDFISVLGIENEWGGEHLRTAPRSGKGNRPLGFASSPAARYWSKPPFPPLGALIVMFKRRLGMRGSGMLGGSNDDGSLSES